MRLIGLAGKKRVGKSSVADYLASHGFIEASFASPMKRMLSSLLYDVVGERQANDHVYDDNFKESVIEGIGVSFRQLAQTLGTEWGRGLDPDFWLKVMEARLSQEYADEEEVVISDVRFENEAAWIRARGGVVVHIVRDTGLVDGHASEAGIVQLPVDYVLENNGRLPELYPKIDHFLEVVQWPEKI
jgi:hypothetical protein